jgi:hypothetical protein
MTPTAHAYTRMHRDARRAELRRAARAYGIAALITGAIALPMFLIFGDVIERTAADALAAQVAGGR